MDYLYPNAAILVFCKAPIPGQVKTRLTTAVSPETATEIHMHLTQRTLALVTDTKIAPVQLWCSPDIEHSFFQTCVGDYGVSLHPQPGGDLGTRMHQAFFNALAQYQSALIIGCDCPSLTRQDLSDGLAALHNGYQVILAPAEDGGYTLIGLNQVQPLLFKSINWGSNEVLTSTKNTINELNLSYFELPEQWDVDTPEDLQRYQSETNCSRRSQ